jgi:PAS domain S-box-containing protein
MNAILFFGGLLLVIVGVFYIVIVARQKMRRLKPHVGASNFKKGEVQTEILLQSVADGVIATDTSGKINLINPAAADMLEWSAEDTIGLSVQAVAKLELEDGKPLPDSNNPFNEVMQTKQAVKKTLLLKTKSGKAKIISLVVSPVVLPPDYQIAGTVYVMRDVSRQHQEEMRRAEFISTASHEMRTPVAAIEGYLALAMNEHVSKIDGKARDYLEKAHSSTQHLGKLFQDLLTSAKAEDGRLSNRPVVVNLSELLDQVTQDIKFSAEKKGLGMEFIMDSGGTHYDASDANSKVVQPLYYVHVDPDRLREVITNLVDNAIKYTEAGKITIGLTGDPNIVQMFVRDTGPGIPAEDIPHLFQKFYRVNNTLTRTQGGTGLGLFICRKIVELYSGRIWVESQQNKGSTFYINLPRLSKEKAAELMAEQGSPSIISPS